MTELKGACVIGYYIKSSINYVGCKYKLISQIETLFSRRCNVSERQANQKEERSVYNMRQKPNYDWKWFESKTPFKKIFENYCDLTVEKEVIEYPVFACLGIYNTRKHYKITVNRNSFTEHFDEIKNKLLATNVCKHNTEIFDYVNNIKDTNIDFCNLITEGCIKNAQGSFEWKYINA